jgi:hypothetical protein
MPTKIQGGIDKVQDGVVGLSDCDTELYGKITALTTINLGEAKTASGTVVDFTGIPAGVKRVTVMFDGVSVSGTSFPLFQLGDSGGIENTGYVVTTSVNVVGTAEITSTAGFPLYSNYAANTIQGAIVFCLVNDTTNSWVGSGSFGVQGGVTSCIYLGGRKSLSNTLDRLRITTVNGTDEFDAGTINISWEF